MYRRGRVESISPFEIECANCRSHDVDVHIVRRNELEIKCNKCASYLNTDSYNELTCKETEGNQNIGCGFLTAAVAVIALVLFGMIM